MLVADKAEQAKTKCTTVYVKASRQSGRSVGASVSHHPPKMVRNCCFCAQKLVSNAVPESGVSWHPQDLQPSS